MYVWKQMAACGTGWPDFLTVQKLLRSRTFTLTAFLTEAVSVLENKESVVRVEAAAGSS